ncbi:hypothetical protein AMS68_004388 [Peltaster fructicola]|uniref:Uncharacterized protein n=1 Tax=Peltaster fructicola TaxID=286661 RepID=A0A6H0XW32_9PEZI|nr:hypothetical protein AMS68_004388 [Peltaster fructicola]
MDPSWLDYIRDADSDDDTSVNELNAKSPVKTFTQKGWSFYIKRYDNESESNTSAHESTEESPVRHTEQITHRDFSKELPAATRAQPCVSRSESSDDTDEDKIELTGYNSQESSDVTESPRSNTEGSMLQAQDLIGYTRNDSDSQQAVVLTPPRASRHALPSVTNKHALLNELSKSLRIRKYRKAYGNNTLAVKDIQLPPICKQYPELSEEIVYHYMKLSTFSATIWLNYDVAEKKFYVDDRIEFCGKLKISATVRAKLEEWEDTYGRFSRFIFNLCTPFHTLGWARLHDDTTEHPGFLIETHPQHKACTVLADYFNRAAADIQQELSQREHHGYGLDEIDHIADWMTCRWWKYANSLSDSPSLFIQPIPSFRESTTQLDLRSTSRKVVCKEENSYRSPADW